MASVLKSRELLAASGSGVDAFSYHHYGAASIRCTGTGTPGITADAALSEAWLRRTDETLAFYRQLRDEFEPGKPFWLTETADAACGGNPWGGTFLDTFRYLDQLGRLARQDVRVHMHNTLVASDYGLLDDKTLAPSSFAATVRGEEVPLTSPTNLPTLSHDLDRTRRACHQCRRDSAQARPVVRAVQPV